MPITLQKEKRSVIEKKWGDYKTQLKAYRSFLLREEIEELENLLKKSFKKEYEISDLFEIN